MAWERGKKKQGGNGGLGALRKVRVRIEGKGLWVTFYGRPDDKYGLKRKGNDQRAKRGWEYREKKFADQKRRLHVTKSPNGGAQWEGNRSRK